MTIIRKSIIILLILTLILSGCSKPVNQQQQDTIRIGWIGPLTGDQAAWGQCELNAVKLMFEKINNENSGVLERKLEIYGYDTKGDPNEAVNAVRTLIEKNKVSAILGPNSSSSAISISELLETHKVAAIATVATNPRVTVVDGRVKPYNFRVCFIDSYQGAVAAGYAIDYLSAEKASILYDSNDEYSIGLAQFFEDHFVSKGGRIVSKEHFKAGDIDFTVQLTRIKESNPDVLFMPVFYNEAGIGARQARSMGINAVFIGGDGWPSEILYNYSKEYIEGSYIVNHLNTNDPEVQELQKAYKDKYSQNMELNGYLVHDAVLLLVEAIKHAGEIDSEKIANALVEVELKGITGNIKLGKDTHNPEAKEAAIIKIVDGKEVFVQKYSPK